MKHRCYCTIDNDCSSLFLCEMHSGNIEVTPVESSMVDPALPFLAAFVPNKTFFLNVEVPFKSASKAGKVMDSVLDAQLPFSVDKSKYVFRKSVHTALSGAHKFNVFGVMDGVLTEFMDKCDFSGSLCGIGHIGILAWDEVIHSTPSPSNEVCFVYFEHNGQGCLLYGFNNGLEACYSVPVGAYDRLLRTVKTVKTKYQVQFEMAADIRWVNIGKSLSDCSQKFSGHLAELFDYEEREIDEDYFFVKVLARQFFSKKLFNLLEGEEYITQKLVADTWKFWFRTGVILSSISILFIAASIVMVKLAEKKLYQTDDEINAFASEIAGYKIPSAMKGETVYTVVSQAIKKREHALSSFDIKKPADMQSVWNLFSQYKSDGKLEIHSLDIADGMIAAKADVLGEEPLNLLKNKLNELGFALAVKEKKTRDKYIECRLEIYKSGENDEE